MLLDYKGEVCHLTPTPLVETPRSAALPSRSALHEYAFFPVLQSKKTELEGFCLTFGAKRSCCCSTSAPKPRFSCKNIIFPPLPPVPPGLLKDETLLEGILSDLQNEITSEHSLMINDKFAFQAWGEEFSNKRLGSTLHLGFPVSVCLFSVSVLCCGGFLCRRNTTFLEKNSFKSLIRCACFLPRRS